MPAQAYLIEVEPKPPYQEKKPVVRVDVEFKPQTLRLTHTTGGPSAANIKKSASEEQTSVASQPSIYKTSLSLELLFDTTRDGTDVRQKTGQLVRWSQPVAAAGDSAGKVSTVRFAWGSLVLRGYIEGVTETLELFSADGVPLRATASLSMHCLYERAERPEPGAAGAGGLGAGAAAGFSAGASAGFAASASAGFGASAGASAGFGASAGASAGFGASAGASASFGAGATASFTTGASVSAAAGVKPLTLAVEGDTVQAIVARSGGKVSWKAVAAANDIPNPRLVPPGTVLDLRASVDVR